jgi:hypothetical protein
MARASSRGSDGCGCSRVIEEDRTHAWRGQSTRGDGLRNDFVRFGVYLILIGVLFLIVVWANDPIAEVILTGQALFMVLAALALIGGAIYFFFGMLQQPVTTTKPPAKAEPSETMDEGVAPSSKTGPGWHCTWCWAPLQEGSRYCNICGRKIE